VFVEGSILDEVKLKRVFFAKPQMVFHLAALFANQNSLDHPETDLLVNGLGTLKLLQYSRLIGVERFVYASSGCSIYGSEAPLPLREEYMSLYLSTPYQITKMLGELYGNFFLRHYRLPVVKARFFNSYGPGEIPGPYRNVIPNFIYWALQGQSLPITGTGQETRDFTYVGDIVDGLLRAGYYEAAVGQEFNLASGVETRIIDLAKMINVQTGNPAGLRFTPRRRWDTKTRLWASVERAPVAWFREHWELIRQAVRFWPGISGAIRTMTARESNQQPLISPKFPSPESAAAAGSKGRRQRVR